MTDYIKRADAIKYLTKASIIISARNHTGDDKALKTILKAIDEINALPSADAEQPDYCIAYGKGVCGYPIEACCECPKHEYYRELEKKAGTEVTDLISRAEAIERIIGTGYDDMIKDNVVFILRALQSVSADRQHGEWKPIELNGYQYVTCDQCGMLADMVDYDGKFVMSMANADEKYANYCPNCGARMKGGEE